MTVLQVLQDVLLKETADTLSDSQYVKNFYLTLASVCSCFVCVQ